MTRSLARSLRAFCWALALVVSGLLVAASARADELHAALDVNVVEVGQAVTMRLEGSGTSGEITDVEPGPTPGFRVVGRSVMPTRMVSIVNGVRTDRGGVSATFTLVAERVGTFTLGPPTAAFGGRVRRAERHEVKVVPKGQGPRRAQSQDPFARFFAPGSPFENLTPTDPEPTLDPKLALPKARGAVAFLHATLDRTRAYVGEQVTYAVYLYIEADGREPQIGDVHEAPAAEFLKRTLLDSENEAKHVGLAKVGDRIYEVKLVRRAALFPLKAGVLPVGAMSLRIFRNPTLRARPESVRETEPLEVTVVEPPVAGRPPGTAPGDVGEFTLRAEVAPREVPRGGAVAVTLTLEGRGNFPNRLALPSTAGTDWLEPEISERFGADGEERFGGARTFKYIVRVREPGTLALGAVAFPHFSPRAKRYEIARVDLGAVNVTPDGRVSAPDDTKESLLPALPRARGGLEGARLASTPLSDRREAWLLLFASPLTFVGGVGLERLTARLRAARRGKEASPEADLERRLGEAERALATGDWAAALRATLHALEQGARVRLGVSVRGLSATEKRAALVEAGHDEELASAWLAAFASAEAARYSPTPPTEDEARAEVGRARALATATRTPVRRSPR